MYVPTFLHTGAIKSDAGVQGFPFDGVCKQGKPCTPGVISSIAKSSCITFNRTPFIPKDTLRVMNNLTATLRYYRYPQHAWAFHVSNALKLYSRSEKVIDACCGDGIISYWLAHWHPETQFIGIDLEHNEDACSWIKQKCPNLDFIQGDINNEIPAYKGSTLLIINSLFVIPDTERLISLFSGLFPVVIGIFPLTESRNFKSFTARNPEYPNSSVMSKSATIDLFSKNSFQLVHEINLTYIPFHSFNSKLLRFLVLETCERLGIRGSEPAYWLGVFINQSCQHTETS